MIHPLVFLTLSGALAIVPADDAKPAGGTTVPSDPVFRATLTDGTSASGRIRRLDLEGGVLALDGADGKELAITQVVSLVREGGDSPPALPEASMVVFPDGDRLRALIGTTNDTTLQATLPALGDQATTLPLESLLGIVLTPPIDPDAIEAMWKRVRAEPRNAEILWLANGDRLTGSLLGLTADKLEFQPDTGPVTIPRSSAVALGSDPALVKYPRPPGPFLELTFTDGSRLGVVIAKLERGHITARTRFGADIQPDLKSVAQVHVRSRNIDYLSERKPAAAQYIGYLGKHPESYGQDSTWDGHALRLAGQTYDRGLGTLPRTLLAFRLEAQDTRFQALVGLDDRAGELGNVVFRVLVDGQERFATPALGRRNSPVAVDVDVAGGKLLILATEFGERGDVQDVADWAEARIVRP